VDVLKLFASIALRPVGLHRTVARKFSIGGLYICAGGLTFVQGGLDIQI